MGSKIPLYETVATFSNRNNLPCFDFWYPVFDLSYAYWIYMLNDRQIKSFIHE